MFKKLISLIVAFALTFSFALTAVSCDDDESIPEELLQLINSDAKENAGESQKEEDPAENTPKEREEKEFLNLFEYLESVKDESAVKVFALDGTIEEVKSFVDLLYKTGMIDREFLINLAISQAKIEGVEDFKDLMGKLEEAYPYQTLLAEWKNSLDTAKEGTEITLDELKKYESYKDLLLNYKEDFAQVSAITAFYFIGISNLTGLDALKAFLAYKDIEVPEELTADTVEMIYSYIALPFLKDTLKEKLEEVIDEVGFETINAVAEQILEVTFEDSDQLLSYVDNLIDFVDPYVLQALDYVLTHNVGEMIGDIAGIQFNAEGIAASIMDMIDSEETYAAIGECIEEKLPYAELVEAVESGNETLTALDLVTEFLEAFADEDDAYYNLANEVLGLKTLVLTKEVKDQIIDYLSLVEAITLSDVASIITAFAENVQ